MLWTITYMCRYLKEQTDERIRYTDVSVKTRRKWKHGSNLKVVKGQRSRSLLVHETYASGLFNIVNQCHFEGIVSDLCVFVLALKRSKVAVTQHSCECDVSGIQTLIVTHLNSNKINIWI